MAYARGSRGVPSRAPQLRRHLDASGVGWRDRSERSRSPPAAAVAAGRSVAEEPVPDAQEEQCLEWLSRQIVGTCR